MSQDILDVATEQSLIHIFSAINDPRVPGRSEHKLIDIILMTLCALICGATTWYKIQRYAVKHEEWFRTFLELPNGIPSYKTFCRIFCLIPHELFADCLAEWASRVNSKFDGDVLAIDGKTAKKSARKSQGKKGIHLVNVFSTRTGITLDVEKTAEKSNEVSAIPKLLKRLDITGCTVTIDAMGCQKGIAKLAIIQGADYVLSLKDNHKKFRRKIEALFSNADQSGLENIVCKQFETTDYDHGRIERRKYTVIPVMYLHLNNKEKWHGLETVIRVESTREFPDCTETATRYYITSIPLGNYLKACHAVRDHWSVENRLHWHLDVSLNEDRCRAYNDNSATNLSALRKIALYYLEDEPTLSESIANKMWEAMLDTDYLRKVVGF